MIYKVVQNLTLHMCSKYPNNTNLDFFFDFKISKKKVNLFIPSSPYSNIRYKSKIEQQKLEKFIRETTSESILNNINIY